MKLKNKLSPGYTALREIAPSFPGTLRMRIMLLSCLVLSGFQTAVWHVGAANACVLHASPMNFTGFKVEHRGVIPIAIATRKAIDSGQLTELPKSPLAKRLTLQRIGQQALAHMQSIGRNLQPGPPVAVLLSQTGAWMRFNDPISGAEYHSTAPQAQDAVIVLPDIAYAAVLDGSLDVADLIGLELMRVYGTSNADSIVALFTQAFNSKAEDANASSRS